MFRKVSTTSLALRPGVLSSPFLAFALSSQASSSALPSSSSSNLSAHLSRPRHGDRVFPHNPTHAQKYTQTHTYSQNPMSMYASPALILISHSIPHGGLAPSPVSVSPHQQLHAHPAHRRTFTATRITPQASTDNTDEAQSGQQTSGDDDQVTEDFGLEYLDRLSRPAWKVALDMRERYYRIEAELNSGIEAGSLSNHDIARLSREISRFSNSANAVTELVSTLQEILDNAELVKEQERSGDREEAREMLELLEIEKEELLEQIEEQEEQVITYLLPEDEDDERNAILEVRAGSGGDEAAIFAKDVFDMYASYSRVKGWKFRALDVSFSDKGGDTKGYKEATAMISGSNVFGMLKYETGGHRVQRVPATESQGRVHTSAMTVAILPEAEDVDIKIEEKDLIIETYRSSGPGGQSVNTTDSAVRITHRPTGIVASNQNERSQGENKKACLKVLQSRIYEAKRREVQEEHNALRSSQLGSGDRSQRIRTYNYPQGRVTDHRINSSKFGMDSMMNGELLDDFVEELKTEEKLEALRALNDSA